MACQLRVGHHHAELMSQETIPLTDWLSASDLSTLQRTPPIVGG